MRLFEVLLERSLIHLGNKLEAKSRNPQGYQIVMTGLCIAAAIAGLIFGIWLGVGILHSGNLGGLFVVCGMVLFPAGIVLLFNIYVDCLPCSEKGERTTEDEDDAYAPGWRRSDRKLLDGIEQAGTGPGRTNSNKRRRPNMDLDEGYDEKFMRPRREQIEPDEHRPDDGVKAYRDRLID